MKFHKKPEEKKRKTWEELAHWGDSEKMHLKMGFNAVHNGFYIQVSDRSLVDEGGQSTSYRIYLTDDELLDNFRATLMTMTNKRGLKRDYVLERLKIHAIPES